MGVAEEVRAMKVLKIFPLLIFAFLGLSLIKAAFASEICPSTMQIMNKHNAEMKAHKRYTRQLLGLNRVKEYTDALGVQNKLRMSHLNEQRRVFSHYAAVAIGSAENFQCYWDYLAFKGLGSQTIKYWRNENGEIIYSIKNPEIGVTVEEAISARDLLIKMFVNIPDMGNNLITEGELANLMIKNSIAGYTGNCPCPYNVDARGASCGRRSAWSRSGGAQPKCYTSDFTVGDVMRARISYVEQFVK